MNQALPEKAPLISIPRQLAIEIVNSIYLCAEEMKEESALTKLNYITSLQDRGKFWDKINTRISQAPISHDCVATVISNVSWPFVLLSHNPTRLKFSLMREERFKRMQREVKIYGKLTYPNVLVQTMNKNLKADPYQMTMYPIHNYDMDKLASRVELLENVYFQEGIGSGYYMLILIDCDSSYDLHKVTAVIVDPNLNIVESSDWSLFIPVKDSVIVEKILDSKSPSNDPTRGLTLKNKAHLKRAAETGITMSYNDDSITEKSHPEII